MKKVTRTLIVLFLTTVSLVGFSQTAKLKKQTKQVKIEEKEKSSIEKATKDFITQFRQEVSEDKDSPKAFTDLLIRLESDNNYATKLIGLIQVQDTKSINAMLTEATNTDMQITYLDSDSEILHVVFCAYRNGVKHCWPSQRNSMKCLKK
jgi:hypothetical protein